MTGVDAASVARWEVGSVVSSIALSRDGTRVASGSHDGLVRIWDLLLGCIVLGPLEGHTQLVQSVAFSHDDTRIASGSRDGTIRIWDVCTGNAIGEPLNGHGNWIWSIAFSPDDTNIISGSDYNAIHFWDVRTGALIGEPLKGHAGSIYSVEFSPDSTRIVSCSEDRTIRMWDARTRTPIGEPLVRHHGPVCSVAFSPNGTRIVSGSADGTICIWDAHTRAPVGERLVGHTASVYSVSFSAQGSHIVSGSHDETVRIWDTLTGARVGEPLKGHTNTVNSVLFSPDSTRIVSGSWDNTIRVWKALQTIPPFDMVSSNMSTQDMFNCLVKHGCTDLTLSLDTRERSSSAVVSGGFGDVWRATLHDGTVVAIKTLRLHTLVAGNEKGAKRAVREVYIWSKLRHPNIQKLLGIVVFQGGLGMVSHWMKKGNLQQYIAAYPDVERYPLCIQLALGVLYLHSIGMVHGDLKATNVLVSQDETLKISDFDYAILSDSTLHFSTTTRPGGGTLRWMAPELFQPEGEEGNGQPPATRSKQTDVYALGMTMLEIITGAVPYAEYRDTMGIYRAIDTRKPPKRPKELSGSDVRAKQMWALLLQSWSHDPSARPDASSVLTSLRALVA